MHWRRAEVGGRCIDGRAEIARRTPRLANARAIGGPNIIAPGSARAVRREQQAQPIGGLNGTAVAEARDADLADEGRRAEIRLRDGRRWPARAGGGAEDREKATGHDG